MNTYNNFFSFCTSNLVINIISYVLKKTYLYTKSRFDFNNKSLLSTIFIDYGDLKNYNIISNMGGAMIKKIIEIKREYNSTSLCEICFTTAQNSNLYRLDMGFEIDGIANKKSKILCNSCVKQLKETLKNI